MTTDFAALATTRELRAAMTAVSRQPDLVELPDAFLSWAKSTGATPAGDPEQTVIELVKDGVLAAVPRYDDTVQVMQVVRACDAFHGAPWLTALQSICTTRSLREQNTWRHERSSACSCRAMIAVMVAALAAATQMAETLAIFVFGRWYVPQPVDSDDILSKHFGAVPMR